MKLVRSKLRCPPEHVSKLARLNNYHPLTAGTKSPKAQQFVNAKDCTVFCEDRPNLISTKQKCTSSNVYFSVCTDARFIRVVEAAKLCMRSCEQTWYE